MTKNREISEIDIYKREGNVYKLILNDKVKIIISVRFYANNVIY